MEEILALGLVFSIMIGLTLIRRWLRERKAKTAKLKRDVLSRSIPDPAIARKQPGRR